MIHGGFWRANYKRDLMDPFADALTDAGWATWNIEYRCVGEGGGYPATIADIVAAREAAPEATAAVAIGHSAGGHLALYLAARGLVDATVALGGVCDLHAAAADRLGNGAALDFMGSGPEQAPADWDDADPIRRLPLSVPVTLVHGRRDRTVPVSQARTYHAAAGDLSTLVELDCGHFEVIDPASHVWPQILAALERYRPAS